MSLFQQYARHKSASASSPPYTPTPREAVSLTLSLTSPLHPLISHFSVGLITRVSAGTHKHLPPIPNSSVLIGFFFYLPWSIWCFLQNMKWNIIKMNYLDGEKRQIIGGLQVNQCFRMIRHSTSIFIRQTFLSSHLKTWTAPPALHTVV